MNYIKIYISTFVLFSVFSLNTVETKSSNSAVRIIGGQNANAGQFPFAAAIYVQTHDNSMYFCGGALMNHYWVLTAGHCVNSANTLSITLGVHELDNSDGHRVLGDYHIVHPYFNPATIENDLGLIRLRQSISYTAYIQPINLPSVSLLNNTGVTAVGWGQTSDFQAGLSNSLQYVGVAVLSNAECRLVYGSQITDNMACVEGNNNQGTCIGDNGSPLIEYLSRSYWVVGVASFISENGCESSDPSGYTRTFPYTNWIISTISTET